MKIYLRKISIFILLFMFVYCGHAKNTPPDTIPQSINILGDKYYPPYEMVNENEKPEGFCIDLIKEVMKRLNRPYTIQLMTRNEVLKRVKGKHNDIILELTFTPERATFIHYGTIYNYAFKGVLYRKNEDPISRFDQFRGKAVVAEKGSYAEKLLRHAGFGIRIIPTHDLEHCSNMLLERKCNAVFCNYDIAKYIANHNSALKASVIDLPPEKFCIGSNNEALQTKIDFIIYDLKREGIYNKLLAKWMNEDRSEYYLHVIYVTLGVIATLFVLFIIFYILLRFQVRKAKKQLERNQQSLAMSLHAGDISIWGYDIKQKRFYNVFCNYFPLEGLPYEKEIKKIHPDDVGIFIHTLQETEKGNPPKGSIIIRMDEIGTQNWRYIEKEIHPVADDDGCITKIFGTHKDVTERISKDRRIKELLNDHEVIFNHTSIGTQYFDAEGYLLKINDVACHIFGVEDKKALLKARPNLFEYPQLKGLIDRNNMHNTQFVIRDDFDFYSNQQQFNLRKKHGIHYIETYVSPVFGNDGKLICIIVNNSDLTEKETLRKQVEDYAFRMKYILKASGVLTWTYNPDTKMSESVDESKNVSECIDWNTLLSRVGKNYRKKVKELLNKMNNREMDTFSMQVKFDSTYVDAEAAYYTIEGTPVKDESGKIKYYLGLSINVTEMINIQHNLQHEKEEAQKADKLKSAFLANVSHEIRTPLNSIVGFSDLLQYTNDDKERQQFIDIIKTNNERLLKIIDDVLDLSKIESGTMKITIEPVDVESIFSETYEVFTHQTERSPVSILYYKPYESCIINTDRVRFTQVLTNFMTNAVKYTAEGSIRMGYENIDNGVKIYVIDTGTGIPHERKEHVFERFEKLDSFVQGTGLGLSICKDIAIMFNGKVGVESDLGKGSTFWMWIPGECQIR